METINSISDLAAVLDTTEEGLRDYFASEIYPVTVTHDEEKVTFTTDADRVPFTKSLRFPFTEDDVSDAMVGLQCVTDYAMHEGYWNTHKDLFDSLALRYAEEHGIIEYNVNKEYME